MPHERRGELRARPHDVLHARFPSRGKLSYPPELRAEHLASISGSRGRLYFQRQRLLELGAVVVHFLTEEEIAHRAQTRITRSVRKAKFLFLGAIEDFDCTFQSSVRLQLLGSFLGPELVSEGRNLILSGPAGTGKTRLAIGIAYRAIQNGSEARFTTAATLIEELSNAARIGRLTDALHTYMHPARPGRRRDRPTSHCVGAGPA